MDIDLARTFLEIIRGGSFIAAAERMHLTQTAVTARIQNLESQLGCRLFVRNRAGARLTDDGERFVAYANQLVQTWEAARRDLPLPLGFLTVRACSSLPAVPAAAASFTARTHSPKSSPELTLNLSAALPPPSAGACTMNWWCSALIAPCGTTTSWKPAGVIRLSIACPQDCRWDLWETRAGLRRMMRLTEAEAWSSSSVLPLGSATQLRTMLSVRRWNFSLLS